MSSIRSGSPTSILIAAIEEQPANQIINVQIFIPCFNVQKCIQVNLNDTVWDVKRNVLADLPKDLQEGYNYGLFLPPCNGRAGKFLLEDRPFRDYPFQNCVPYLEMKYKKRVYKSLTVNEKLLTQLHTKTSLKRFMEYVEKKEAKKVEDLCSLGLDPNFHNSKGETPLTVAACFDNNRPVLMALIAGGAHLDFRNSEGQTPLHRAVFLSSHANVKALLDLGASPNSRDPLNLTPLYYSMLRPNANANSCELLLRDYAEIGVTDPHGNQEIHQACKNGLVSHLEHLLYYGADINSQNVNGNTPLHICAVNNQEGCARVLLFRSADHRIVNNQGQTAYHVAVITGHTPIAEMLKNHDPQQSVPYRAQPRYNSKRRLTWSRSCVGPQRRKSIVSLSQCDYGSVRRMPALSASENASPAMPRGHLSLGSKTLTAEYRPALMQAVKKALSETGSNYSATSTIAQQKRRPSLEKSLLNFSSSTIEYNVPRIMVIPRGQNGFGFILRGAKKLTDAINFEPNNETPALQYFEDVDITGMAAKAGLRPNDFLLEINGIDVRCCNHDQVVQLIQMCEDTITLKVITVSNNHLNGTSSTYGTLRQVKRASQRPPLRTCASSLSVTTGRLYTPKLNRTSDVSSLIYNDNSYSGNETASTMSKSEDYLPAAYRDPRHKVASIRSRSQSRRISASELEELMARQNGITNGNAANGHDSSNNSDNVSMSTSLDEQSAFVALQNAKVYNSVSEMKRTKQQKPGLDTDSNHQRPPSFRQQQQQHQPSANTNLRSFNSSPNLHTRSNNFCTAGQDINNNNSNMQIYANDSENSSRTHSFSNNINGTVHRRKITVRPKTPPPPPPPPPPSSDGSAYKVPKEFLPPSSGRRTIGPSTAYFKTLPGGQQKTRENNFKPNVDVTNIHVPSTPPMNHRLCIRVKTGSGRNGGGQQPDDLMTSSLSSSPSTPETSGDKVRFVENEYELDNKSHSDSPNFNYDLQTALARRRSQVETRPASHRRDSPKKFTVTSSSCGEHESECDDDSSIQIRRKGYVNETNTVRRIDFNKIIDDNANGNSQHHHQNCKSIIKRPVSSGRISSEQDSLSLSSTMSSLSACSSDHVTTTNVDQQQMAKTELRQKPSDPPPDYDDADSGNADSDGDDKCSSVIQQGGTWQSKTLTSWTVNDVCKWLDSLYLSEYKRNFARNAVDGCTLMNCSRAQFAQLGVTRIAHRLAMESSLKLYKPIQE